METVANRRELIIHSGYIRAAVEALSSLMGNDDELRRQWRAVRNSFGPVDRGRRAEIFSTARAGTIFADPVKTRRFAEALAGRVDEHLRRLLDHFAERPWRYMIFEVSTNLDRCLININQEGRQQLLFSPEAVRQYHKGGRRLMGLIFDNGQCLQSWGSVIRLDSFFEEDIHYFAGEAAPEAYRAGGIARAMEEKPVPFFMLGPFSPISSPLLGGEVARSCISALRVSTYNEKKLEHCRCRTERMEEGDVVRLLLGSDPGRHPPVLYADRRSKSFILAASTLEQYRKGRLALLDVAPFPLKPQRSVSAAMEYAAGLILGTEPPWRELDRRFFPPGKAGPEPPSTKAPDTLPGKLRLNPPPDKGEKRYRGEEALRRMEQAVYHCLTDGKLPDAETVVRESGCDLNSCTIFLGALEALISGDLVPGEGKSEAA